MSIVSNRDTILISAFWNTLLEKMNINLNRPTTFHPQMDGKIVVNNTLVQTLRGNN